MSLQGTFDTLSVTELFGLLATAGKTGALRLEAGEQTASVLVAGGRCYRVESDGSPGTPSGPDTALAARLVDIGFAFGRLPGGSFRFSDSETAPIDSAETADLEPAVAEIRSMLDQWRDIEASIPSLDAVVRLAPSLREDEIILSAAEWGLLVALVDSPSVRALVERRSAPMLQVCRELVELVDRGAVEVEATAAPAPASAAAPAVSVEASVPRPIGPAEPPHRTSEAGPAGGLAPTEPYAPGAEGTPREGPAGLTAVAAAADAIVAAEAEQGSQGSEAPAPAPDAEALAAGIVGGMARSRRKAPDPFAGADGEPAPAVPAGPEAGRGASSDTPDGADGAQDRGALLRLFSALKDS